MPYGCVRRIQFFKKVIYNRQTELSSRIVISMIETININNYTYM